MGVYHQLPHPHLAFKRGKPKISFLFHFKKERAGTPLDLWIHSSNAWLVTGASRDLSLGRPSHSFLGTF